RSKQIDDAALSDLKVGRAPGSRDLFDDVPEYLAAAGRALQTGQRSGRPARCPRCCFRGSGQQGRLPSVSWIPARRQALPRTGPPRANRSQHRVANLPPNG
ncbi:hypothetical protein, partial [Arthrobacter sp. JCM 19049]|uniref:hypothetical protein n=1 Tax=Arthrobacter sp. JCM 19049 TaxID=1460643 RepID=UPI0024373CD8